MDEMTVQWEHYIEVIEADPQRAMPFVQQFYPPGAVPRYAIQAIIPHLDDLGRSGWELVQIQPVFVGQNGDICVQGGEYKYWTNAYLCAFKRVKRSQGA